MNQKWPLGLKKRLIGEWMDTKVYRNIEKSVPAATTFRE
jgi:hypothetical protein